MTRTELNQRLKELEQRNGKLLWENLRMRLQLEVLAENPAGKAAAKIIAYYKRKIEIRNENSKATQN